TLAYENLKRAEDQFLFDFAEPEAAEDPRKRWEALCEDMPEATDNVEQKMGPMPEAGLDALETVFGEEGKSRAIAYSAGDADDTFTLYPILKQRIEEMDLERAYALDIAVIPMIDRMMHTGFAADREYLQSLGSELAAEMKK